MAGEAQSGIVQAARLEIFPCVQTLFRSELLRQPGHQKQRLGLARALILRPKVIVCDEALASLDMSMRSQLINLMLELQEKQGISYIYVTQHLGMMKHISDQVLVMLNGEVGERGSTADVLASPLHDLTRRLIAGHFGEALTADAWRKDGK